MMKNVLGIVIIYQRHVTTSVDVFCAKVVKVHCI